MDRKNRETDGYLVVVFLLPFSHSLRWYFSFLSNTTTNIIIIITTIIKKPSEERVRMKSQFDRQSTRELLVLLFYYSYYILIRLFLDQSSRDYSTTLANSFFFCIKKDEILKIKSIFICSNCRIISFHFVSRF